MKDTTELRCHRLKLAVGIHTDDHRWVCAVAPVADKPYTDVEVEKFREEQRPLLMERLRKGENDLPK